jgi:ferredoxin
MPKRHPDNAPGDWYIDTRCTDWLAARTVAPGLIVERDGQSVFARQPKTAEELRMAWRARSVCPTASVAYRQTQRTSPDGRLPRSHDGNVYRLGYKLRIPTVRTRS